MCRFERLALFTFVFCKIFAHNTVVKVFPLKMLNHNEYQYYDEVYQMHNHMNIIVTVSPAAMFAAVTEAVPEV